MKKLPILCIVLFFAISASPARFAAAPGPASAIAAESDGAAIPLSFKSVRGTWALRYSESYGYMFSFYANYRAVVVLYLNMETLVFKGVYTIDEENKLKINIYEMKQEHKTSRIRKGFVKAKSSYFLFGGHTTKKAGRETLYLRPLSIIIDGNNSEGYFEPLIKLAKK